MNVVDSDYKNFEIKRKRKYKKKTRGSLTLSFAYFFNRVVK